MSSQPSSALPEAHWRPTGALSRALVLAAVAIAVALLVGDPSLVVLAAPFVLLATLGLVHRPSGTPRLVSQVDHRRCTRARARPRGWSSSDAEDAEYLTRASGQPPYVALRPSSGHVGALLPGPVPDIEVSPRRWGRRMLGEEKVALYTPWAGYRFGPVQLGGQLVRVLPPTAPYDSRAEAPQPLGLVGAHRSRRGGSGTELAGIRPFPPGDRLRRINWRVSLRTGTLHVVSTRAEEDTGVLLVVDALADHGASDGIDGASSSLDLTVRAAAAIAEHHVRAGDRVALRVVGRGGEQVGYGAGAGTCAGSRARSPPCAPARSRRRRRRAAAACHRRHRRHRAVADARRVDRHRRRDPDPARGPGARRRHPARRRPARGARRHRPGAGRPGLADAPARAHGRCSTGSSGLGCPVVPWRGPGTVDDVLRRLSRRAQLPRVVSR